MAPKLRKRLRSSNKIMSSVPLEQALSDLKMENNSAKPPIPTNWFHLPVEMRELVIDQMDAETRCKFAQCSKLCEKEAKESKNYMYGISVLSSGFMDDFEESDESCKLQLGHHKEKPDYTLKFIENGTRNTTVVYEAGISKYWKDEKWRKVEKGKPAEVRAKYFKKYIEQYKNSIKLLYVYNFTDLLLVDNARNLKNLENITITYCPINVIDCGFVTLNQVIHATFDSDYTSLTFEEIVRLEGLEYIIRSDDFEEKGIIKYVKMWKNGEVSRNLRSMMVYRNKGEPIDLKKLVKGMEVFDVKQDSRCSEFKFYADHDKQAQLSTSVDITPSFIIIEKTRSLKEALQNRI